MRPVSFHHPANTSKWGLCLLLSRHWELFVNVTLLIGLLRSRLGTSGLWLGCFRSYFEISLCLATHPSPDQSRSSLYLIFAYLLPKCFPFAPWRIKGISLFSFILETELAKNQYSHRDRSQMDVGNAPRLCCLLSFHSFCLLSPPLPLHPSWLQTSRWVSPSPSSSSPHFPRTPTTIMDSEPF